MDQTRQLIYPDFVFDVWAVYDLGSKRVHYPSYGVSTHRVGCAFDLEGAERIVREVVRKEDNYLYPMELLHSFRIVQMPVGVFVPEWESTAEYIYDKRGIRIDKRTFPYADGIFPGRTADEIRFKEGDLCEVLSDDRAELGIVVKLPPSPEWAAERNSGPFHMDATDDCYSVLTDGSAFPENVDALRILKPQFKVSLRTERRLRKAYHEFITRKMRLRIADTTARERLRDLAEALGWTVRIDPPAWEDDTFNLEIEGVRGFHGVLNLEISQKKAHFHFDRIRITFLRLAGIPADGRGYRLKRKSPKESHIPGVEEEPLYYL